MCCLFGMIDCDGHFSGRQRSRMLAILAEECEARGTDAAGIAFNSRGTLKINKHPGPAHTLKIRLPDDANIIMGHTRMTTQGSERKNYNNHPFLGQTGDAMFALAHNGVLYNDHELRQEYGLPETKIETDSYVAVQLIEYKNALNFDSLMHSTLTLWRLWRSRCLGPLHSLFWIMKITSTSLKETIHFACITFRK